MNNDLVATFISRFGDEVVLTGDKLKARGSGYLDSSPLTARALLRPRNTSEIAEILSLCSAAKQSVVPHGGLTNLVYNTRTTEKDVIISLEMMNKIEEVNVPNGTMTVQAGATLQSVQEAANQANLFFPLDLAARASATVGGLIASNAGGTRVLRFGMMRELVLGLEAVLADGTILSSLTKVIKNNAGYDLKQLLIGTEGTLGIVTRAVLRLWPVQPYATTALLAMQTFDQVIQLLSLAQTRLGGSLTSFEVMWNAYYRLTTTPPAPNKPPISQNYPLYVLIEGLGSEPEEDQRRFEGMLETAQDKNLFSDAVLARSSAQQQGLWRIREDSDQIEAQFKPTYGFDISLPIPAMEKYIAETEAQLRQEFGPIHYWVYGHVGDGNLHLGVWGESIQENCKQQIESIIYEPLMALGGSISAEHGIGLEKKDYLRLSRTPQEIEVMRRIKAALDPQGILNPGKIFDLTG